MLTLTEAVIIRTANERIAAVEAALAACRRQLSNEQAARRQERAAADVQITAMATRMAVLEDMIIRG